MIRAAALLAAAALAGSGAAAPFSHDLLDGLLGRHVRDGLVDYAALKQDPGLRAYMDLLAAARPDDLPGRAGRLAFWINAYNACVLKGVADHHPIRSVRDLGLLGRFTFFKGLEFSVAGRDLTLDAIEHGILRAEFGDARIHFALVCASLGCPRLRSSAFHAERIEEELEAAARAFVRDPAKVRLDRAARTLHLSAIFDWYAADFEKEAGSVLAYVRRYLPPEDAAAAGEAGIRIVHDPYDWALNGREPSPAAPGRGPEPLC
jgi:hypothetical protein